MLRQREQDAKGYGVPVYRKIYRIEPSAAFAPSNAVHYNNASASEGVRLGPSTHIEYVKHATAIVESSHIGKGTYIGAFAHILPGAVIGAACNLNDHTVVDNGVRIGDRVTVQCGVQLWDGITIEDDVVIGPNATFANGPTVLKRGASIDANATILPGIVIGEKAQAVAGSVVTRDVPSHAIVTGNPAKIVGYNEPSPSAEVLSSVPPQVGSAHTKVAGVTLHRMPHVEDLRGTLTFGEAGDQVPFAVKRYFLVFDVANEEIRGEHAHRTLHQFLICVHGRCHFMADDGRNRQDFILDNPAIGIHIPPMIWGVQHKYTRDAVLLALASDKYDPTDYIRNYSEFLELVKAIRCSC